MLFTSVSYFLFLITVLILYYVLPGKYRNLFLVIASAIFYMYVKAAYLIILLMLITANFFLAIRIEKNTGKKEQKNYLAVVLVLNIGVLFFFKYLGFFVNDILGLVMDLRNINTGFLADLILPLGLSYYTFQAIGYIMDIYRGAQKAERNFLNFSLFILFFPKLLVGPIERGKRFLPQLNKDISFNTSDLTEGGKRIAWGLFKKLVVADRISLYVSVIDANPLQQSGLTVLMASLLYTLQVYADFSGYADIAIGSARLFGYNLMENFSRPFLAKNLSDFWRRWHISLSSWVNDYIFNPVLLQHRKWGNWGVFYALMVSFILIGVWHGATWNYVLFGALQAVVLMFETLTKKQRIRLSKKIPGIIYNNTSILLTYLFVSFGLIIFRTPTPDKALIILKSIFNNPGLIYFDRPSTVFFILLGSAVMLAYDIQREYNLFRFLKRIENNWFLQHISYAFLLIYILVAAVFDGGQFIYFNF